MFERRRRSATLADTMANDPRSGSSTSHQRTELANGALLARLDCVCGSALVILRHLPYMRHFRLGRNFPLFDKKESYTPAEAKRACDQLDQLVATKQITSRQASAHRMHVARRVRVALKPSYTAQAAKRAKTEIGNLTEAGTITMKSAAAYRAHITKRTVTA